MKTMENGNVKDAEIVAAPAVHKDTLALEALRTQIKEYREDFKKQLAAVKEALEARENDIKNLTIKKHKLEGAIEASDLHLKPATPASK